MLDAYLYNGLRTLFGRYALVSVCIRVGQGIAW